MRRLMASLVVLMLVAGCAGPVAGPGEAGLAKAAMAHMATTGDDATSGARAANDFGLALYGLVAAADASANLVMSPASIALALSMARAGARGDTAAEMDRVLRDLGSDEHAAWIAGLDAALTARTGRFRDAMGDEQEVTLRIANAPFAQHDLTLEPAYLDALAQRFGAGVRLVDYRGDPDGARATVNRWIAEQTEQRIPEMLAQGTVDDLTRLLLVNAIYLKAAWETPFLEAATMDLPFHRLDGSTVEVPMMRTGLQLPYAKGDGWQAVELPYVGGQLAMTLIVPDDLAAFEAALDRAWLDAMTGRLAGAQVELAMPRFSTESRLELGDVLAALGMPTAFTDRADFSGMTTEERLAIAAVIHQANIDVDEAGTEAAAATVVAMAGSAAPTEIVTLTIDRPFLFALRDTVTGAVVFLGRIADPSAGR
jgi:serpin B